mgnify:CR=1 FL=1
MHTIIFIPAKTELLVLLSITVAPNIAISLLRLMLYSHETMLALDHLKLHDSAL